MAGRPNPADSRRELEARILAAALKQSFERGDMTGALLAHRQLSELLRQKVEPSDGEPTVEDAGARPAVKEQAQAEQQPPGQPQEAAPGMAPGDQPEPAATETMHGQAEPAAPAAASKPEPAPPAGQEPRPEVPASSEPRYGTYYDILELSPMSSFEAIHVRFLKMLRALLQNQLARRDLSAREFRDRLRTICVAHDVLRDPNTRTDYDFRLMGLRGEGKAVAVTTPDEPRQASPSRGTPLRIGELLQCSQILEATELEIAVDMHKAMPEMPFGQFLVKQGFLSEDELHSALLGQKLIVDGCITVAQFQVAMSGMRESQTPLSTTLVMRGWASQADIDNFVLPDPGRDGRRQPASEYTPPALREVAPAAPDPDAGRIKQITTGNAVPSWAEQIDWAEPAEEPGLTVVSDTAGAVVQEGDLTTTSERTETIAVSQLDSGAIAAERSDTVVKVEGDGVTIREETLESTVIASSAGSMEIIHADGSLLLSNSGDATVIAESAHQQLTGTESSAETGEERLVAVFEDDSRSRAELLVESTEGADSDLSPGEIALIDRAMAMLEDIEDVLADKPAEAYTEPIEEEVPGSALPDDVKDVEPISRRMKHTAKPAATAQEEKPALAGDPGRDPVVLQLQEQLTALKNKRDSIKRELSAGEEPAAQGEGEPVLGAVEPECPGDDTFDASPDHEAAEASGEAITGRIEEEPDAGRAVRAKGERRTRSRSRRVEEADSANLDNDVE